MLIQTSARLAGLGHRLASIPVPSSDWDARFGWPAGTTETRTGIRTRFRCGPREDATTLAREAIAAALDQAGITPRQVALLIETSACHLQPLPANASCLLETLGVEWRGVPGFDVKNTCLGFLQGLQVAVSLLSQYPVIVVTSAETPWAGLRHEDPESAPLFGDGAAAAVVVRGKTPRRFYAATETFGEGRTACEVPAGGHRIPYFTWTPERDGLFRFNMDGKRVHRLASTHLPALVQRFRKAWSREENLTWVPHPASGPAVELLRRKLRLPHERFFCTLADHGNMISAGIPVQLARARDAGRLTSFAAVGTAAGYAQGILAWEDCDAP